MCSNIKGKLDWMKEDIEVSHLIDILHESMFKKKMLFNPATLKKLQQKYK